MSGFMTTAQANAAMGYGPRQMKAYWDARAQACRGMADEGSCLARVARHVPVTIGGLGQDTSVSGITQRDVLVFAGGWLTGALLLSMLRSSERRTHSNPRRRR